MYPGSLIELKSGIFDLIGIFLGGPKFFRTWTGHRPQGFTLIVIYNFLKETIITTNENDHNELGVMNR